MKVIDGELLRRLVPMDRAIDAVDAAFRARDDETPPRQHVPFGDAELLFMPSRNPRVAGVKLVTVNPHNPERGIPLVNGAYLLFDGQTLQPTAVIDGSALTAIRTAAVSGAATRALAHPDSEHLVIFGAGAQAHAHLDAICAVRDITEVSVISRSEERARPLVDYAQSLVDVAHFDDPANAVAEAHIVCTCTTSSTPLFEGRLLNADAHVNAVGSYKSDVREIDSETVRRAAVVCVETLEVMGESGDLATPLSERALDPADVVELQTALDRVKPNEPEITVFKSVGQAFEDLAVAEAALRGFD